MTTTAAPAAPAVDATPTAAADTTLLGGEPTAAPEADTTLLSGEPTAAPVAAPAEAVTPADFDLKLPENSIFDPAALKGIATFARELALSPEAAQRLVERDSKMLDAFADHVEEQVREEHRERVANWAKEVKDSKDLGGEKYAETTLLAGKAMQRFATPELRQALNETGFGNHPELVRLFAKIGKSLSEDSFTTKGIGEQHVETDTAKTLFPTMN